MSRKSGIISKRVEVFRIEKFADEGVHILMLYSNETRKIGKEYYSWMLYSNVKLHKMTNTALGRAIYNIDNL